MMITHAVKMLTSPDPLVQGVAQHSPECTIRKKFGETEGHKNQWRFLAGQLKSATESCRGDVSSIWSRLRAFAGETGVRLYGGTSDDPTPTDISIGDRVLYGGFRRVLLRELRTKRGKTWLSKWASLAKQGGFARTISQASESNYWLRDCRYLRYREYRWAIKARLNLLPVAAHRRKYEGSVADTRCKGCMGTQEHCLNVCQANMPAIKARHDRVMERLVGAIPDSLGTKFLDQTVLGCPELLKPDVVILQEEQKKAFLINVACPCDRPENITVARGRKREKYAAIKEQLEGKGFQVCCDSFIVGLAGNMGPRKRSPTSRDWDRS